MMHTARIIPRVLVFLTALALSGSLLVSPGREAAAQVGVGQCPIDPGVALLWDIAHSLYNGTPMTPPSLPLPGTNWVLYSHPYVPLLSFLHPPDWTPHTIAEGSSTIGVDLIRADSAAAWQYLMTPENQGATARQWTEGLLRTTLGVTPQDPVQVLCESDLPPVGIYQDTALLVVSVDSFLALGMASIASDGLSTFVLYRGFIGRTQEFTQLTSEVFLPIEWQLLIDPPD